MTRSASLMGIDLRSAEMDVRAYYPHGAKYGLDQSTACESLDYTVDLDTDAPPARVYEALRWAERACHVVNTFREPVPVHPRLRLNGRDVPDGEWGARG